MRIQSPPLALNLDPYSAVSNPLGVQVSGGAAVLTATGGLPRRVTGALDWGTRALALNPSGFWRLDEVSGQMLDRTANARHLTVAGTPSRGQPGHGRGGDSTGAVAHTGGNYSYAAAVYPEHGIVEGSPFACVAWFRGVRGTSGDMILARTKDPSGGNNGWCLSGRYYSEIHFWIGTNGWLIWRGLPLLFDDAFHIVALRYTGGPRGTPSSWELLVDGVQCTGLTAATTPPAGPWTSALPLRVSEVVGVALTSPGRWKDTVIWTGASTPTLAQLVTLSGPVACGTARWTLPTSTAARTLRGMQVPGTLARVKSITESRLGVRAYYQIDAGARTEFEPGSDPAAAIPAGSVCCLDLDLTHNHLDDLPWIGTDLGGGPVALVEEADPPAQPLQVSTIRPVPVTRLVTAQCSEARILRPHTLKVPLTLKGE